jgi:hypothetical protein
VLIHGFIKDTDEFPIQKSPFLQVQGNQVIARKLTRVRRTSDSADLSAFGAIDAEIVGKGHLWMETK